MNTATITQAQDKGLFAETIDKIRAFAIALYSAHGGWFVIDAAQPASGALAHQQRKHTMILGGSYENYGPALAAELNRTDSK